MPRQSAEARSSTASFNARAKTVAFRPDADLRTSPFDDPPDLPVPFLRQFRLPSPLSRRFCLGFRPRLYGGSLPLRRSCFKSGLQWPRRRKTRPGQISRQPQLPSKFFLLDESGRRLEKLISNRSFLLFASSSRSLMRFLSNGLKNTSQLFYHQLS